MRKVCGMLFIFFDLILLSCNGKEARDIQSAQTNLEPAVSNTHIIEEPVTILQENATVQTETEAQAAIPPAYSDIELKDPFLLHLLKDFPTIRIDVSDDCINQRIWHKDFDNKIIDYGDYDDGVMPCYIYLFQEHLFLGIDYAETEKNTKLVRRERSIILYRSNEGTVIGAERYGGLTGRMDRQDVYNKTNNILIANDGLERGFLSSVIVEEDSKFLYYDTHDDYNATPARPRTTIEFFGNEVEVTSFDYSPQEVFSRYYFTDGILMKREFPVWGYTETYTVRQGKGEIIVTNSNGTEREQRMLERRINDKGYLEYEAVRFPDGTGYEQYFRKGLFR